MARKQLAPTTPAGWAGVWVGLGFPVVPLKPGTKEPAAGVGWQEKAVTDVRDIPANFPDGVNIGILTGHPDSCVADVDKDCPEAIALSLEKDFLPDGGLWFGRNSVGFTHIMYRAAKHDPTLTRVFWDSYVVNGERTKLLELRYAAHQTMVPGSIRVDKEPPHVREPLFCRNFPPTLPDTVSLDDLRQRCAVMAATIIVKRAWPGKGGRDDFALAVLGGLAFHGVDYQTAWRIVVHAARLAGDEEYYKRGSSAARAKQRIEQNEKTRGFGWIERAYGMPAWGAWLLKTLGVRSAVVIEEECKPRPTANTHPRADTIPAQPRQTPRIIVEGAYQPFPVHTLAPGQREVVEAVSEARNVDPAMVAAPSLTAAASLIGSTHRITPNRDWFEDCALWTIVICDSGTRKTPAFGAALAWIEEEQGRLSRDFREARQADRDALADWRAADKSERGPKPEPTAVDRCLVTNDATIEAIARILGTNPRGVLYAAEEIDNWFQSLTRYNNATAAYYLQLYSARLLSVRRADPDREPIVILRALANLTGTIQPGVFQAAMTTHAVASGLLARPLLCWPDPKLNLFQRFPSTVKELEGWKLIQQGLYRLQGIDDCTPRDLMLSPHAVDLFAEWNDKHAHRVFNAMAGAAKNADNKLFGTVLRLALVHHLISCVHYASDPNAPVPVESVQAALTQGEWWSKEHARIYAFLEDAPVTAPEGLEDRIIRFFRRRPGQSQATGRELQQALKDKSGRVTQDAIREAVEALANSGWGACVYSTDGDDQRLTFTYNRARDKDSDTEQA